MDASRQADDAATQACRAELRAARLAKARPAARKVPAGSRPEGTPRPLYVGVVQVGRHAVAVDSGAVLAEAPHHWTDGCPVLVEECGPDAESHAYLDPLTGRSLLVDVLPRGKERAISMRPRRWTEAGATAPAA